MAPGMIPENLFLWRLAHQRQKGILGGQSTKAGHASAETNTISVSMRLQKPRNRRCRQKAEALSRKKPSKLEFTADELPPEAKDNKLTQARRKAERTTEKLEQAEACLPSRRKLRIETASDPETGKAKKHLKFEQEVKSQRAHVKGSLPMRPVKAGANTAIGYAHKKRFTRRRMKISALRRPTGPSLWGRQDFAQHTTGTKQRLTGGYQSYSKSL